MEAYDVKRFLEWAVGDPRFRRNFKADPLQAIEKYEIDVDLGAVTILFDEDLNNNPTLLDNAHPAVKEHFKRTREVDQRRDMVGKQVEPDNDAFARWRSRQINLFSSNHRINEGFKLHRPFSIELSKGCSIHCDYCAFNVGRLTDIAKFTHENQKQFRQILFFLSEFFGKAANTGLLYFATEPFDNPDYEQYLQVFHQVFGVIPHTTTAAWFKDIERTKRLIKKIEEKDGERLRLSVNSLDCLALCMRSFTAKEMENVRLILNNPGAIRVIRKAGRGAHVPGAIEGSIACLTGFIFNLSDRTIRLISPRYDLKKYPLGYRTFAKESFDDIRGILRFLQQCQETLMR